MTKLPTTRILLTTLFAALLVSQSTAYDLPKCVADIKNSVEDVYHILDDFLHKEVEKTIPLAFNLVEQVGDAALYYCKGATIEQIKQYVTQVEAQNIAMCVRKVLTVLFDAKMIVEDVKGGQIVKAIQEGSVLLKDAGFVKPACIKIIDP